MPTDRAPRNRSGPACVRGSLRKFREAGLRVDHLTGKEAAGWFADDRLHPLYLAVLEHAGGFLETLPPAFFRQLFELWHDQAVLTLVRREDRTVAWGCSLLCPPAFHMLVMGLDYEANRPGDVYFNLVYACLDYAMRRGAREVWIGANADQFKARLGCQSRPRYVYVRGMGAIVAWLVRRAAGWFFPPPAPPPRRGLFRQPPRDEKSRGEGPRLGAAFPRSA